ncbi:unnamed protein product [Candida verbasci]|uniref:Zn(2)-C6 fungal-type domain-containing protein n=1 Tax=Candida verbasci TaxID=1227364 RepID=A0A9W4XBM4_9ASCO|nr:unnamed protein product [Candida verbasci]
MFVTFSTTDKKHNQSSSSSQSKVIDSPTDFHRFRDAVRSKNGCLTCKIRKKKCNEVKPICSDCLRLKKKCFWINENMTDEEIKQLKEKAYHEESLKKLRKRKSKKPKPVEVVEVVEVVHDPLKLFTYNSDVRSTNHSPNSPSIQNLINEEPPSPSGYLNLLRDLSHTEQEGKIEEIGSTVSTSDLLCDFENSLGPNKSYLDWISSLAPSVPQSPIYIPELNDPTISYLYNYYVEVLSQKVSISPSSQNDSNSFQKIFLPLAHRDKGVFYSLLVWSGFHLGGYWSDESQKFFNIALDHLSKNTSSERNDIIIKLATLMILVGAEICKGDVKNWSVYLNWGWNLLSKNGGILNFNSSKEENWLISNFAYHDLLASSSIERGTYFPSEEYEVIFNDEQGYSKGSLNPLLGVSKVLYRIIGDISTLLFESKKLLDQYYNRDGDGDGNGDGNGDADESDTDSEISDHAFSIKLLNSIISKVEKLETEINNAKPDKKDLINLTDQELELQLTLFEAFQLSSKLFLKQSIMKCNPSQLESQMINNDLIKCLDILVGTSVQASLVFPIFMSGIHCVTTFDRIKMSERIDQFIKLYGMWNVTRVKFVIEKIWKDNPNGDSVIDWHSSLKELGWDLNFA